MERKVVRNQHDERHPPRPSEYFKALTNEARKRLFAAIRPLLNNEPAKRLNRGGNKSKDR